MKIRGLVGGDLTGSFWGVQEGPGDFLMISEKCERLLNMLILEHVVKFESFAFVFVSSQEIGSERIERNLDV